MTSILWRCPPDTRPAQRFCDYVAIIILFSEICKSTIIPSILFMIPMEEL